MKMCVVGMEEEGNFTKMGTIFLIFKDILGIADQSVKGIYWDHLRSLVRFFPTLFLL